MIAVGNRRRIAPDVPGQFVGQHRTQERRVHQPATEFLGDDRHLDAGGAVGAQRPPARRRNLLVQPRDSLAVLERLNRSGSKVVGQFGGGVAQLLLFSRQTDIHTSPSALGAAPCPKAAEEYRTRTPRGSAVCTTPAAPPPG